MTLYYIYILEHLHSKTGYIGKTENPKNRFNQHKVDSLPYYYEDIDYDNDGNIIYDKYDCIKVIKIPFCKNNSNVSKFIYNNGGINNFKFKILFSVDDKVKGNYECVKHIESLTYYYFKNKGYELLNKIQWKDKKWSNEYERKFWYNIFQCYIYEDIYSEIDKHCIMDYK